MPARKRQQGKKNNASPSERVKAPPRIQGSNKASGISPTGAVAFLILLVVVSSAVYVYNFVDVSEVIGNIQKRFDAQTSGEKSQAFSSQDNTKQTDAQLKHTQDTNKKDETKQDKKPAGPEMKTKTEIPVESKPTEKSVKHEDNENEQTESKLVDSLHTAKTVTSKAEQTEKSEKARPSKKPEPELAEPKQSEKPVEQRKVEHQQQKPTETKQTEKPIESKPKEQLREEQRKESKPKPDDKPVESKETKPKPGDKPVESKETKPKPAVKTVEPKEAKPKADDKPVKTKETKPKPDDKPVEHKETKPKPDDKPVEPKETKPKPDNKPVETKETNKPDDKPVEPKETKQKPGDTPVEPKEAKPKPENKPVETKETNTPDDKPVKPKETRTKPDDKTVETKENKPKPDDKTVETKDSKRKPDDKPIESEEKSKPNEKPVEPKETKPKTDDKPVEPKETKQKPGDKPTDSKKSKPKPVESKHDKLNQAEKPVEPKQNLPVDAKSEPKKNYKKESKTDSSYEKASVTNGKDAKFRDELDKADSLLDKEKAQEALAIYDKILSKEKESPRALFGRARSFDLMADQQQSNHLLEQCIEAYLKAIAAPDAPRELVVLAGKRCVNRQNFRGWHGKAVNTMQLMMEKFPSDTELINEYGVTNLMAGRIEDAREAFRKVLRLDKENGFAKVHLGFIIQTQDRRPEKAVELLQEGIATNAPGVIDGRFFFHLGDALYRLGRHEEAYEVYAEGAEKGLFKSKYQRSLYNVDRLAARPWWTYEQTKNAQALKTLEKSWKIIRDEGLAQLDPQTGSFIPEDENLSDTGEWKQFTLFQQGKKNDINCRKTPKTCDLVSKIQDAAGCRRGQVKFSVMQPGVHVWPHCGPTNCRVRAHLGLVIPEGPRIRVADETRTWKEGEFIIFDDSFEHEVWHDGDKTRLVLIVDLWHPDLTQQEKNTLSAI